MRLTHGTIKIAIISALAISLSLFQLWTSIFGVLDAISQRSIHLFFVILLVFLLNPISGISNEKRLWLKCIIRLIDIAIIIGAILAIGYVLLNATAITMRLRFVTPVTFQEILFGLIFIFVVLEAARRAIGPALPIIAVIAIFYAAYGYILPRPWNHGGYTWAQIVEQLVFSTSGVLGIALSVAATYIAIFLIFGAFLDRTGAGNTFLNLATALTGRYSGGPAKTAVIASGFMGMVSGNAVANVASTGIVTIPLMIKIGFKRQTAAAVEALASTGGQILPPVMGATAFLIAEFLGISYWDVAIAAIIPAALYFYSVGIMVHFEAGKENIKGLEHKDIPPFIKSFRLATPYLIPVGILVGMLMYGYTPIKAGVYALIVLVLIAFLLNYLSTQDKDFSVKYFIEALDIGGRNMIVVSCASAISGVVIGILSLTGLGLRLSSIIMSTAGENVMIALLFSMAVSLILGMGMPPISTYIIQVVLVVPALVELGVPELAAHLFVFYFGILCNVTPPIALASFTAAGIAKCSPMQTALKGLKMGTAVFILPFMFVYNSALLMDGSWTFILLAVSTSLIGLTSWAAGTQGFLLEKVNFFQRTLLLSSGLFMILPNIMLDIIGLALLIFVFLTQTIKKKTNNNIEII